MRDLSQLIIIQPTPFCNIDCKYCYLPNRTSKQRISEEILRKIFYRLFTEELVSINANIVWHAGEPLVMPIEFYRTAYRIIQEENTANIPVSNNIQTNATLITKEWCDFFKETDTQIGVSLDGPLHIHDKNRTDRASRGTFDKVMRGIRLLQQNSIDFTVITVLTSYSLDYPEEIFRFFVENNIFSWAFNIEELEGANTTSSVTDASKGKFRYFMSALLDFTEKNSLPIRVRELDFLIGCIKNFSEPLESSENTPFSILNFDCNGNFSTFSPELLTTTHVDYGDFVFGNVFDNKISTMWDNVKFQTVYKEISQGREKCKFTCEYYNACGGGPPVNKLFENGTFNSTETSYCRLKVQLATDIVLEYLESKYTPR